MTENTKPGPVRGTDTGTKDLGSLLTQAAQSLGPEGYVVKPEANLTRYTAYFKPSRVDGPREFRPHSVGQ
jgi:hypothetical protein